MAKFDKKPGGGSRKPSGKRSGSFSRRSEGEGRDDRPARKFDRGGKPSFGGPRKRFEKRDDESGDKKKSFRRSDDKKDFASKKFNRDKAPFERKKFEGGERRSFGSDRPSSPRRRSDGDARGRDERRPFRKDGDSPRERSGERSDRSFRSPRKRDDGDFKPRRRERDDEPRSRDSAGSDRPKRRERSDDPEGRKFDRRPSRDRDSAGSDRPKRRERSDDPTGRKFDRRPSRDRDSSGSDRPPRRDRSEDSEGRKFDRRPPRDGDSAGSDRPKRRERKEDGEETKFPSRDRDSSRADGPRTRERDDNSEGSWSERRPPRDSDSTDPDEKPREERSERRPFDKERSTDRRRSFDGPRERDDRPFSKRRESSGDFTDKRSSRGGFDREEKRGTKDGSERKRAPAPKRKQTDTDPDLIRLNKYLSNAGIASRREADVLIESGAVKVNGEVITQLGYKIRRGDKVTYGDESVRTERKIYLLLNKPKDYITTTDDPRERRTVMELVSGACNERIYPVGRLDRNTTGVLLFTNDGELAKKLTHPKHDVRKVYHVTLNKGLRADDFKQIVEGVELEDGVIVADDVSFVGEGKKEIGIEIHSGKNRVVRRIFEHLGYDVLKLDRVLFAGLTKKDVPRGRHRFLTPKEVSFLKMIG